jgi:hypothetical protein
VAVINKAESICILLLMVTIWFRASNDGIIIPETHPGQLNRYGRQASLYKYLVETNGKTGDYFKELLELGLISGVLIGIRTFRYCVE